MYSHGSVPTQMNLKFQAWPAKGLGNFHEHTKFGSEPSCSRLGQFRENPQEKPAPAPACQSAANCICSRLALLLLRFLASLDCVADCLEGGFLLFTRVDVDDLIGMG